MENSSTEIQGLSPGYYEVNLYYAVVWSLVFVIGVAGNITNLSILPRLQAAGGTKIFLTALSLSDLLTAVCLGTKVIVSRLGWADNISWDLVYVTQYILGHWASVSSACLIVLVNFDRYLQVVRPYKYHEIITGKRALFMTVTLVLVLLIILLLRIGLKEVSFDKILFKSKGVVYIFDTSERADALFSICLWPLQVLVVAMYAHIFCIVRKHAAKISAQENAVFRLKSLSAMADNTGHANLHDLSGQSSKDNPRDNPEASQAGPSTVLADNADNAHNPEAEASTSRPSPGYGFHRESQGVNGKWKVKNQMRITHQNLRNLRTTCLVTGCYVMAWLPFSIVVANAVFAERLPNDTILLVTYTLGKGNCCINCFVYMFWRSDFKATLRKLFR